MKTLLIWLKRLLFGWIAIVMAAYPSGMAYQYAAVKADERNFPPPGRLLDVGGYKVHIYCTGEGSPTVILDAVNRDVSR